MRLLLLSAGRRVSLLQQLRRAAQELQMELFIVGTEIYEFTSSLYFCDEYQMVNRTFTREHHEEILNLIESFKIDVVLPGNDFDLRYLNEHRSQLESLGVRVADAGEQGLLFLSKRDSSVFFEEIGLEVPGILGSPEEMRSRCILKEDEGYGSVNQFIVDNEEQANQYWARLKKPFLQEFVQGPETTVDVFSDSNGKVLSYCCRRRERVRSGVSDVGVVDMNPRLCKLLESKFEHFQLKGPWNIQCIEFQDRFYFLEVNPRFAGGVVLSIAAGCDFARYFLEWQANLDYHSSGSIKNGLVMMKYEQEVYVQAGSQENRKLS